MRLQRAVRDYLWQHFPGNVHTEPWCTCGSANHARIALFRVNGQPAAAVVPEARELSSGQLRRALCGSQVEPLAEAELDALYADAEARHAQPVENPLGAAVYLDMNLVRFTTLVFCSEMFSGRAGECFRIPTSSFRSEERRVGKECRL